MPNLTLDFRPDLDDGASDRLRSALGQVQGDDTLTLVLPRVDVHQAEPLFWVLDEEHFDYQTKGGHGAEFYITARRKPNL